ncbi:MAG: threonine-phosphate decarboxylase, partial [Aurantimonas coralicida]
MASPDPKALQHGGALDAAIARHGGARADWLDLSTGINPSPPCLPELDPTLWQRLPEAGLEHAALAAARRCYGAPDTAGIVAAPGTQALIAALPHLFAPTDVAILAPTYSEHALTFAAAGHRVI